MTNPKDAIVAPGGRDRWSRSYRKAPQKGTTAQRRALREHWPTFGLDLRYGDTLVLDEVLGQRERFVLEIGFGLGEVLVPRALDQPEWGFLGIEVHKPAVGATLRRAADAGLTNVRVSRIDALRILNDHLTGHPLDEVWVFFPDPFPREKEAHRRILRPLFLDLLELRANGSLDLYVASDVAAYIAHADALIGARPGWTTVSTTRPDWRPVTKYEQTGFDEGRPSQDRHYRWAGPKGSRE